MAIYYKVLKHERSLSVTEPPWVCLPFLTAFVPLNLPTLTMQVLHFICSLFYPLSSRHLTIFVNLIYVLHYLLCYYTSSSPNGFHFTLLWLTVACCQPFL